MLTLEIDEAEIRSYLAWAAQKNPWVKRFIERIVITPEGDLMIKIKLKIVRDITLTPKLISPDAVLLTPNFLTRGVLMMPCVGDALKSAGFSTVDYGKLKFSCAQLRQQHPELPDLRLAELTVGDGKIKIRAALNN